MMRLRLLVTQGDPVGFGDAVGIDGPQSLAQPLTSLAQELERVGGGVLRGGAVRVRPVFLDEVGLQRGSDFVGRLQRVVNGPVPCDVVYHAASIPHRGPRLAALSWHPFMSRRCVDERLGCAVAGPGRGLSEGPVSGGQGRPGWIQYSPPIPRPGPLRVVSGQLACGRRRRWTAAV